MNFQLLFLFLGLCRAVLFVQHLGQLGILLIGQLGGGIEDIQLLCHTSGLTALIKRYIRYTAEELAAQEEARKKAEAREKLPETVAALRAALADADALNVDQDYRLTLLELGVTDDETTESA